MRNLLKKTDRMVTTTRLIKIVHSLRAGEYEMRDPLSEDEVVRITFVMPNKFKEVRGKTGDIVMFLAHK